jgi:hypothetical protein
MVRVTRVRARCLTTLQVRVVGDEEGPRQDAAGDSQGRTRGLSC